MADRRFTIEEDLKLLNVRLNIPAFLEQKDQFSEEQVKESRTIASVRIHVERAIQRVKKFKQIIDISRIDQSKSLFLKGVMVPNMKRVNHSLP